jgi:pimeloyl-ACP methyl ester carboxylesterase
MSEGRFGNDDDEFSMLSENSEDARLAWRGQPPVRRSFVTVSGRRLSAIVWGNEPELVLLHGGAQNAHTWDAMALALDRPLVALDLPGHGRSDWWEGGRYPSDRVIAAVAAVVAQLAPDAVAIAGTGLGASIGLAVAAHRADVIHKVVVMDSTPGAGAGDGGAAARPSAAAVAVAAFTERREFPSLDALVEHALRHHERRDGRALRRGVLHNAVEDPDGTWRWRWDPALRGAPPVDAAASSDALERMVGDLLLVRGAHSDIVDDAKISRMRDRRPTLSVVTIAGAGHSVQSDQPVALARVLTEFLDR